MFNEVFDDLDECVWSSGQCTDHVGAYATVGKAFEKDGTSYYFELSVMAYVDTAPKDNDVGYIIDDVKFASELLMTPFTMTDNNQPVIESGDVLEMVEFFERYDLDDRAIEQIKEVAGVLKSNVTPSETNLERMTAEYWSRPTGEPYVNEKRIVH